MPRTSRQHSSTGVYHVMMRGNGKSDIFIDNEDRYKFLDILYNKKELSEYSLYAYCLMSNHVHLLIKENVESLSQCLKRINISYACYFNKKYERIGHFFQDRYRSECIETDSYLLSALRYIHNNPVKAKIAMGPGDYSWSSYNIYLDIVKDLYLIDKDEILSLFSKNKRNAMLSFASFSDQDAGDCFIDYSDDVAKYVTIHGINEAEKYTKDFLMEHNIAFDEIKNKENIKYRNKLIANLKLYSNLSIRDISQVLNVNRGTVGRIKV